MRRSVIPYWKILSELVGSERCPKRASLRDTLLSEKTYRETIWGDKIRDPRIDQLLPLSLVALGLIFGGVAIYWLGGSLFVGCVVSAVFLVYFVVLWAAPLVLQTWKRKSAIRRRNIRLQQSCNVKTDPETLQGHITAEMVLVAIARTYCLPQELIFPEDKKADFATLVYGHRPLRIELISEVFRLYYPEAFTHESVNDVLASISGAEVDSVAELAELLIPAIGRKIDVAK